MSIFHLPDLGEGLADAEIREWHVSVGDIVKIDQPMVSVETAKAVVDIPVPQNGKIKKLYGNKSDRIKTDSPLVEFEDQGTVVGSLEQSGVLLNESNTIIGAAKETKHSAVKAIPAVRALARQLQVDLNTVTATGAEGQITLDDVKKMTDNALHGVRRAMAITMTQSHHEVVPVTIVEDADISNLKPDADITVFLIQAIAEGIKIEPGLNAWYDGGKMEHRVLQEINLGLAMDTSEGLFVPVLKNIQKNNQAELRNKINEFKKSVSTRTVSPQDLQGASIILSNFGTLTGRYANPIVVPPMVAILGSGKARDTVAAHQGKIEIRRILPLSLTVDHRVITGAEAARFLAAVISFLEAM